jgi:hypothetical protein
MKVQMSTARMENKMEFLAANRSFPLRRLGLMTSAVQAIMPKSLPIKITSSILGVCRLGRN